jgi:hypothetical protein
MPAAGRRAPPRASVIDRSDPLQDHLKEEMRPMARAWLSARRTAAPAFAFALASTAATTALAAPAGGSASGQVGTSGASGSSSGGGYEWPELVVAGNAVQFLAPLQFGIVSYLPKARFAFQYDRQLIKGHWIHIGAAVLADRGGWENFRMGRCGLEGQSAACGKGGVVGFDVYAGYTYKFFIRDKPFIVPYVRGSIGYTFFALPKVGGGDGNREQTRTRSQGMSVRPGGGFRVFLLDTLGIGMDVSLPLGFLVHRNLEEGAEDYNRESSFLFGIEVHPVSIEYRF